MRWRANQSVGTSVAAETVTGPPSPPWVTPGFAKLRQRLLAQVLFVDGEEKRILLARQTERGLLPGAITGLLVEAQAGESAHMAALRAAREVAGLDLGDESVLELRAILHFHETDYPSDVFVEHEFVVTAERLIGQSCWDGSALRAKLEQFHGASSIVRGTPGLVPQFEEPLWHKVTAIPYGDMPADDRLWYPLVLRGKRGPSGEDLLAGRFWVDRQDLMQHDMWWTAN